jgi:hypothetical protein
MGDWCKEEREKEEIEKPYQHTSVHHTDLYQFWSIFIEIIVVSMTEALNKYLQHYQVPSLESAVESGFAFCKYI